MLILLFLDRELSELLICKHQSCCYLVMMVTSTVQNLLRVDSSLLRQDLIDSYVC